MPTQFRFHGYAVGAAGRIRLPHATFIEVQAASALPQIGGRGAARSELFDHYGILKFDAAYTTASGISHGSGSDDSRTAHRTHLQSTVEGLNILDVVTADRVVANVESTAIAGHEPTFRLRGTEFRNLRISGIPVAVDLATDVFDLHETHSALIEACRTLESVRNLMDRLILGERIGDNPKLPRMTGVTPVSLVRALSIDKEGVEASGHVIRVPGFGTIRLAEVVLGRAVRTVSMIQIDLEGAQLPGGKELPAPPDPPPSDPPADPCPPGIHGHLIMCESGGVVSAGDDY